TTRLFDGIYQRREVIVEHIDDDFTWKLAIHTAQEILRKERRHNLAHLLLDTHLRKEILAAQHASAAHADQMHTGAARIDESCDPILIASAAVHALLILHPPQQCDLIAQFSCPLKVQVHGSLFHQRVQLVGQGIAAAFEEHDRVTNI